MLRFRHRRNKKEAYFEVTLYDGLTLVGSIGAYIYDVRGLDVLMVFYVNVRKSYQRRGYGTMLYQEMARIACRQGLRLSSSANYMRNESSTGFWQKQYRAGRAHVIGDRDEIFVLNDPCKGF